MTLEELFAAYYVLYRTEAETPNSEDDEFVIFKGLAKEAIHRWANYDGGFWKELYQTLQRENDGDMVTVLGQTAYATPENMRKAGGFIRLYDTNGVTQARVPIVEPQDVQFITEYSNFCYFVGDPNNGFELNFSVEPVDSWVGLSMDYVYYKKPTELTKAKSVPEMSQPYFIVHRALANRFRGSRNPYYQSAKNDAEDVLRTMKLEGDSGNWADPWKLADNSAGRFGL